MRFTTISLTTVLAFSTLSNGRPLDGNNGHRIDIAPRAKSYAIVNVDGGSTSAVDAATTVVAETTKTETIKITHISPGPTDTVTATVTRPAPVSTPTSPSASSSRPESSPPSSPSASEKPTETSEPSTVTVVITDTEPAPTEYYDNGMWHTLYKVKTFETLAATSASFNGTTNTASSPISASTASIQW
ncbi:hypothetical protein EJ04DRAFT_517264 [Polyplosphaeria fusca]|uniref:Uncharacterized protein n=1 Tax=Polyplosphaeria fusca TaxID=682080 RepID=A0A9P4UT41_9PLEO|nr:hypothetical protein EJ04DRAFT_517264 [Polyplosphaeria fusca]